MYQLGKPLKTKKHMRISTSHSLKIVMSFFMCKGDVPGHFVNFSFLTVEVIRFKPLRS